MRDRSIPWLLDGLGLTGGFAGGLGLDEGVSLLHGLHESEPITVLGSLHTTSDGFAGGGGGLPGSPGFGGGGMHAALDGDVLTGSLPFGPLGHPGRLRGDPSATVRPVPDLARVRTAPRAVLWQWFVCCVHFATCEGVW